MKTISILGCGWMGLPLALHLQERGYQIKGSTTSIKKLPYLNECGISSFFLKLTENRIEGNMNEFLSKSEILIINIPPRLRNNISGKGYVEKIIQLLPFIYQNCIKNVLFISSTSVYGNGHPMIDEDTLPHPLSESGKQLLITEELLRKNLSNKLTILRFGGLVGSDRHPVTSVSGKTGLKNPDAPINLIHLNDCIGIITSIIEKNVWGEVFNAVAPVHPSRKIYYTEKAKIRNLPLPFFDAELPSIGKIVSSEKIKRVLDYDFVMIDF